MDTLEGDGEPLISISRNRPQRKCLFLTIVLLGCTAYSSSVYINYKLNFNSIEIYNVTTFSVFSLTVWGGPVSFGVKDKETRMSAIGHWIANDTKHDVYLLNDLWMRSDHAEIKKNIPKGWTMTQVDDLSDIRCDGVSSAVFCSGLAIISKHPIKYFKFIPFTVSGNMSSFDFEFNFRRGFGLVRLEPSFDYSVDVVVTSLAHHGYNYWYRKNQTSELLNWIKKSSADHLILGGDFSVDFRDREDTYETIKGVLTNAMRDDKMQNPDYATYGNTLNSYTEKGQQAVVHDYIWSAYQGMSVKQIQVLNLMTENNNSFSNHQALSATFHIYVTPTK